MKLDRRSLLLKIRNLVALSVVGTSGVVAFSTQAQAWVQAVLAGLAVISTFVQRPSGLAAMMSAINEKLDVVLEQAAQIERALTDIALAIADLKEKLPELLENAFTVDKIGRLRSAAHNWFDEKIDSREALDALDATRRGMVTITLSSIDSIIYDLAINNAGAIPRAAIAAPLALGVHMNILSLAEPNKIGAALARHIKWHDNILSPDVKNSVAFQLADLRAKRELVLDQIAKSRLATESRFDRKKWISDGVGEVCAGSTFPWGVGDPTIQVGIVFYAWRFVKLTSSGYPLIALEKSYSGRTPPWDSNPGSVVCTTRPGAVETHPAVVGINREMEPILGTPTNPEGLLPQLNNLSGRIAFLEQVLDIVQDTRREAVRMKEDF
ncbi:hypothetical protein [Bradyrhizobium japonicum]|uniref:hypothetical protein n=1 Tax=Bradyrhizobium japonicum TaxID=375 RepID=UPI001E299298|nr:hypothetical protein [Bradyrhizobium japonicum]MCD9817641.1 hypothetical protein [Bradyrhizobium japonicum]MEB2672516.1 hypothetical protein [Bradyrhizobium japonicum]WRI91777.1 hypothetical protein R3F75_12955 [Bradyrhizobium japonicum]